MANGAFKFKDNSGNVVASLSNSGSNIVISGGTLDLSGMTGLTLGNVTMSGTTENASTASFAPSYLLSSSFNSYTGTTNAQLRLSSLETITGSLATTGSNQFKNNQTITGSLTVTGYIEAQELRTTYISSSILYRSGSTKFGDESSDTHAFTGSLIVSGSIYSITNIGAGISSPEKRLHLYATNDAASIRLTNTAASKVWDLTPANPNVANNGFTIYNVTDNTKPLHITDNGNIGIGTTTPSGSLHLQSSVSRIYFTQTPTNTRTWFLGTDYSPNGFGLHDITSNAFRTFWSTDGKVGIGLTDPTSTLHISYGGDNNPGIRLQGDGNDTHLEFRTNTGAATIQAFDSGFTNAGKLLLNPSGGNVGIGVDNPTFKLHIRNTTGDDATFSGGILIENTGSPAGEPAIAFKNSAVTSGHYVFAGLNQTNNFSVAFGTSFTDANTKLQITPAGQILTWGNPAFMAYGNGNATIDYNGTYLIYPSVHVNRGGHYNSSNGIFTAPVAGIYYFSWADIAGNGNDVYRFYIRVNDSTFLGDYHHRIDITATGSEYGTNGNRCAMINLSANDTVRIWFRNDAGATMYGINNNSDSYHNFMGYLIG